MFLPIMIEAGVDSWDGQENANDKAELIRRYGDRLLIYISPPDARALEDVMLYRRGGTLSFSQFKPGTRMIFNMNAENQRLDPALYELTRVGCAGSEAEMLEHTRRCTQEAAAMDTIPVPNGIFRLKRPKPACSATFRAGITSWPGKSFRLAMDDGDLLPALCRRRNRLLGQGRRGCERAAATCACARMSSFGWPPSWTARFQSVTVVLDTLNQLTTVLFAEVGDHPNKPRLVTHRFSFGAIQQPGKPLPAKRHHFTADLVGRKIAWELLARGHHHPYLSYAVQHALLPPGYEASARNGDPGAAQRVRKPRPAVGRRCCSTSPVPM